MSRSTKLAEYQIDAICTKLREEFNPQKYGNLKNIKSYEYQVEQNEKYVLNMIKSCNLPPSLIKAIVAFIEERCEFEYAFGEPEEGVLCYMSPNALKKIKLPYPQITYGEEIRCDIEKRFEKLLKDFRFKLTMASVDDYQELMEQFKKFYDQQLKKKIKCE